MNIDQMIAGVIQREKGYVNDPSDRGGETNWGITIAVARKYGYTGPMRDMPRTVAEAIYRAIYWTEPGLDKIAALSPRLAEKLLDTGVHLGMSRPLTFLQKALNAFNNQENIYPDIAEDGGNGPQTMAALTAYLKDRKAEGESVLLASIQAQQGAFYLDLSRRDQSQEKYVYGWFLNRAMFA